MEYPITFEEAMELYSTPDLNQLSLAATKLREELNGDIVWYNRNFHLEPSNICQHSCKFCSYRRGNLEEKGAWSMTIEEVEAYILEKYQPGMSEIHIVGAVHPSKNVDYYLKIVEKARELLPPEVTIKAYSAVEIDDIANNGGITPLQLLTMLKERGVSALPGGGAEIFNPKIRAQIAPTKATGRRWLEIHEIAHSLGIKTNATMLFGHIEGREERVNHLIKLREQQEKSGGFNAFIPLLFKASNNPLSHLGELEITEVLRTFAISRLILHNIPHIKSYWPMLGKELSSLALLYGADDLDGTIHDSTKIYSMAGSQEQNPTITIEEVERMAASCGYRAIERDSFYNQLVKK